MNIEIRNHIRDGKETQTWDVIQGDKIADSLTWDEMIGLVSSLTIPDRKPCLQWLKTPEERKLLEERFKYTSV